MGQKIHPTGVRIGINKSQSATWFANYQAYSQVLEEDQKIRDFFQKEWSVLYNKAGISKVEIKNKKAKFEFEFIETFTAGIQLFGTEIKSIRNNKYASPFGKRI